MKPGTDTPNPDQALVRKWVEAWKLAGPELERLRREEIRDTETAAAIPAFDGLFEMAMRDFPPRTTSGLIEQQRILHSTRK